MTVRDLVREAVRRLDAAADGDPVRACRHCFDGGEQPCVCVAHPGDVLCPACLADHVAAEHGSRCDWCGGEGGSEPLDAYWPFAGLRCFTDGTAELGTLHGVVRLAGVHRCDRCTRIAGLKVRLSRG